MRANTLYYLRGFTGGDQHERFSCSCLFLSSYFMLKGQVISQQKCLLCAFFVAFSLILSILGARVQGHDQLASFTGRAESATIHGGFFRIFPLGFSSPKPTLVF